MEEIFISSNSMGDILMVTIKCGMAVIVNKSKLKFHVFLGYVLICAMLLMMQPIGVQASDISNKNASPDEIMSQLKTRLDLNEEQESKMRPIIEESIRKRNGIVANGAGDRKTVKSQLQELRWSTDMQIGKILTEKQMTEYEKLMEEQREKTENNETQSGRTPHGGRLRGF